MDFKLDNINQSKYKRQIQALKVWNDVYNRHGTLDQIMGFHSTSVLLPILT